MKPFPLKIVTPGGVCYDAPAEQLTVRAVTGELGIRAGHADLLVPLSSGRVRVMAGGRLRHADCTGGILSVLDGDVTVMSTAFRWEDA